MDVTLLLSVITLVLGFYLTYILMFECGSNKKNIGFNKIPTLHDFQPNRGSREIELLSRSSLKSTSYHDN
jgi:hypothetical protein